MADRFEDLRTFLAVADAGGFGAAAKRLGVVKSAVSRRIHDLENRLGVRLFNRTTRQIVLTEAGETLRLRAGRLLADLAEAETEAASDAMEARGTLRVTAPVSFTIHCLAPALPDFLRAHPHLQVEIDTSDRIVDLVDGGFDLAIRISRLKDSSLIARRIAPIRHVVCASPAYWAARGKPNRPEALAGHGGVLYGYADPRDYWRFAGDISIDVPSRLTLSNGDALREAAIAGAGVVYLPTFIVYRAVARGELEPALIDFVREPIGLYALHPSTRNSPAKVRLFIDFLVARFGERPFWDDIIFGEQRTD